jgi:hypothetical protein
MFDHKQAALDGLFPGTTHRLIASLGWFGFNVSIVVTPVVTPLSQPGGGTAYSGETYYNVTVKVSYNGKSWETTRTMSSLKVKTLEKVIAKFKTFSPSINTILAKFRAVFSNKPTVTVKRKR